MSDQTLSGIVGSRYQILSTLGRGGLGTVSLARDTRTGRMVAIKSVHASNVDAGRILHEATVLEQLHHPNILRIHDAGRSEGIVYLVLEYVEAESLAGILARRRFLVPDVAVGVTREVASALAHAHKQGIIHGDIKPGNLLVSREGRVLLSDFGLALAPGAPTLNSQGRILGTPRYMAPGQAKGEPADHRADIFSLGAVLYEMLAGTPAFPGDATPDVLRKIVEQDPLPLETLSLSAPHSLTRVVSKALAKNPDDRFQSAREFMRALDLTGLAVYVRGALSRLVQPPSASSVSDDDHRGAPPDVASDDDPTASAVPYVRDFETIWRELRLAAEHGDKDNFIRLTHAIVHGPLRETIGYRIEYDIPYFRGTVGYMVDAPMLWIRHSRFPILFVVFDAAQPNVLPIVVKQLEIARATEFFAVLVVIPADSENTGHESEELREQVADSVFKHDFVVLDARHLASIIEDGSTQRLVEVILRQGIGLHSLSPYVVNGPVPERMFFGREQEVKVVSQNIVDRDYAVLGGRRIGKSSILLRLNGLLNSDPRFRALYVNCEEKATSGEFIEALRRELSLEPQASELRSARDVVAKLAAQDRSRRLVLILDEIDELLAHDADANERRLFKTFRSLSHEGLCRFVFSGSRTLFAHFRDAKSPFFNFCDSLVLRPLEEKSIAEIVTKPMRQLGIDIADEERFIQLLIQFTSSHPSIAQWVCDRLVKRTLENLGAGQPAQLDHLTEALRSSRRTTLDDLEAIAGTPEFQEYYVSTAWGDAGALERLISLVVTGPEFTRADVQKAIQPYLGSSDARLVAGGLEHLELYSLIERAGHTYRFRLTEFPRLVRQFDGFEGQLDDAILDLEKQAHGDNGRTC